MFGCAQDERRLEREESPAPVTASREDERLEELNVFLRQNTEIIAQLPNHPLSENVFGEVVQRLEEIHDMPARDVCWKLVQEHPDNSLGLYALEKWLESEGGIVTTEKQLWEIIDAHTDTSVAAYALDKILAVPLASGDVSKASAVCDKILSTCPGAKVSKIALLRLGQASFEAKHYRRAVGAYLRLASEFPETYRNAEVADQLEEAHKALGLESRLASEIEKNEADALIKVQGELARWWQWEMAASSAESGTASEREQRAAALWWALGDIRKIEAFVEDFEGTTEALRGQLILARLLQTAGSLEGAVCAYERFLEGHTTMLDGATEMLVLEPLAEFQLSAYIGLRDLLVTAVTDKPPHSAARKKGHDVLEQTGKALLQLHERLLKMPHVTGSQRVEVLLRLVDFYQYQGLAGKVIETYERIARDCRDRPEAPKSLLKVVRLEMREWKAYDAAADTCQQLIEMFSASPEARKAAFLWALCEHLQSEYDDAIARLNQFIELRPVDELTPQAEFLLGLCYAGKRDYHIAALQLESVARRYPDNDIAPRAQYDAIRMHLMNGSRKDAQIALKMLMEKFKGTKSAVSAPLHYQDLLVANRDVN